MNIHSFLLATLLIGLTTIAGASGNGVNNGGNAVDCRASTENSFQGYYSLDFLAQYDLDKLPIQIQSLDASLDRIQKLLKDKLPELAEDFADFRRGLFNRTDPSLSRYWESAPFGLVDLKDQQILTLLPKNCQNGDQALIVPAVNRQPPETSGLPKDSILYRYVPEVVNKLAQTNPVQLSFLIIHEWLWDFSQNIDRNRRVNYWLHSDRLETWSREKWKTNLEAIGYTLPGLPEPAFSTEFCSANTKSTEKLRNLVSFGAPVTLGLGTAYQRTHLCFEKTGCEMYYSDSSKTIRGNFHSHIRLRIIDRYLYVDSYGSTFSSATAAFFCSVTGDDFSCKPMMTLGGYEFGPELRFNVEVGTDCVRFFAKTISSSGLGDTQVDEYAVVFRELKFPEVKLP